MLGGALICVRIASTGHCCGTTLPAKGITRNGGPDLFADRAAPPVEYEQ
jgi:hypothetical protein